MMVFGHLGIRVSLSDASNPFVAQAESPSAAQRLPSAKMCDSIGLTNIVCDKQRHLNSTKQYLASGVIKQL